MDKEEKPIYDLIMDAVYKALPTTDYMDAENAAGAADRKERAEYGECSGLVYDLRQCRDQVLQDARELASSMAKLEREVKWVRNGGAPSPSLLATLGKILNPERR